MLDKTIVIGFVALADPAWVAGTRYLINLWTALRTASSHSYKIALLVPQTASAKNYQALTSFVDQIITFPPPPKKPIPLPFANKIRRRLISEADQYLRQHQIDVLFSSLNTPAREIPRLHWIPDFQHLHYPEFFTSTELEWRKKTYITVAHEASVVVVSSNAAKQDLQTIAPSTETKTRVLNFVSQPPEQIYRGDPQQVRDFYHLPFRFFFLPNQFWQHKNHVLVLDALKLACQTEPQVTVVCTGTTFDYRDPLYFDTLLARVSALNLQNNFRLLGRVPEEHLYQLIRQSLAVLQPSLFEGWSTSVEECKSIGKAMVLSDIPVHREQCPPGARYFDPHQPAALAEILLDMYAHGNPGPDFAMEEQSRHDLPGRVQVFAHTFDSIVEQALHGNPSR